MVSMLHWIEQHDSDTFKDANKRVVLECGGIELLLRCANLSFWPEIVTTALWNICAESEVQADVQTTSATENGNMSGELHTSPEPEMSTIACLQLTLRSTSECDDKGKGPAADID